MSSASSPSAADRVTPGQVLGRVLAALLGGWAFVWGFCALWITVAVAAGSSYAGAHRAAMLLAFLLFLVLFCWSFAARGLLRVWGWLAGGAATMTALAWLLQRSLV